MGDGNFERRMLEMNKKRIKVVKLGLKMFFLSIEVCGSYVFFFYVSVFVIIFIGFFNIFLNCFISFFIIFMMYVIRWRYFVMIREG